MSEHDQQLQGRREKEEATGPTMASVFLGAI
jgi:hypothetical protein